LNALDGAITSNLAIVPTTNGSISAFASNATHLIIDISGISRRRRQSHHPVLATRGAIPSDDRGKRLRGLQYAGDASCRTSRLAPN